MFREASNHWKMVLEASNLFMLINEDLSLSRNLTNCDFWRIAMSFLNKGKSAMPPLFNGP